jgi:hypothetical protein
MKYLNNREEFLKRSINKIDEYKSLEDNSLKSINEMVENSGPFANDIPWNDSLLGRLINSTIRKAKVGANLVRIKAVANRLKDAFNELLYESAAAQLDEEDQKTKARVLVFWFLYELQESVKKMNVNKTSLSELKGLTKTAISEVTKIKDLEDKNELLRQLNEWYKFLESLKEDDNIEAETEEKVKREGEQSTYGFSLQNFKSVLRLILIYKNEKAKSKESSAKTQEVKPAEEVKPDEVKQTKPSPVDVTTPVNKNTPVDANKSESLIWLLFEDNAVAQVATASTATATASAVANPATPPTTPNNNVDVKANDNKGGSAILNSLKSLFNYVSNAIQNDFTSIDSFLKSSTEGLGQEKYKASLTKVYAQVKKKEGITENIDTLLTRPEGLGDKLFELHKISKTKLDGNFEELSEEMKKEIANFNKTMKAVLYPQLQFGKEPKKVESLIGNYSYFLSKVNEADEAESADNMKKELEVNKPKSGFIDKVQSWWNENVNLTKWLADWDKDKVNEVRVDLDKKLASKQDSIVINGMDPIIEIVKVFNRAYKLHTTQVIPTGRTAGKVSNKTFREYTSFGGGSPDTAGAQGGPYRNNSIFNQWEEAVMNIKKNKDFQKIFRQETVVKTEDGKIIKNAGKNLGKFMVDMLEGEELYKSKGSGTKGQQAIFLEKYFGYTEKGDGELAYGGTEELKENESVADSIKTKDLTFSKKSFPFEKYSDLIGTFFAVNCMIDGKADQLYFYIQGITGENLYLTYCKSFYFFKTYIESSSVGFKGPSKGDLSGSPITSSIDNENKGQYKIKGFRIGSKALIDENGNFKPVGNFEITYVTKFDGSKNSANSPSEISDTKDVINIQSFLTLKEKDEENKEKRFKLDKDVTTSITNIGGFPKIASQGNINLTKIVKK